MSTAAVITVCVYRKRKKNKCNDYQDPTYSEINISGHEEQMQVNPAYAVSPNNNTHSSQGKIMPNM